ncbi:MAG: tetratricopeptide repeat protein [Candidatus Nealsonbacteria bacterium]|nr:tetratricopeptide repeat protein [Candidatus Nealsonbacteria bacterium]
MNSGHVFISYATPDKGFVKALRAYLERLQLPVWVDSRRMQGGDALLPEIRDAIEQAGKVIGVFSPATINSRWVRRELELARKIARRRKDDGYAIIPILLPGVEPTALDLWFKEEPLAVKVALGPGGLSEAGPQLAAALGVELPDDFEPAAEVAAEPLEELRLKLVDPFREIAEGKTLLRATAVLHYDPADPAGRKVESKRFPFTAPLGPIEKDDLRWYLEEYFRWPVGQFADRAAEIEQKLPEWGRLLYDAALAGAPVGEALSAWQHAADGAGRRFSIEVDSDLPQGDLPQGTSDADQIAAREAACGLFALPWELLHDQRDYLFQGARPVGVRRRLPSRHFEPGKPADLPIRILLVSPRPEDKHARYIDHRASALPLVTAIDGLGDLVELTMLTPPTLPALRNELDAARQRGEPVHVIHFDGHGVYSREHGLGALCFEDPADAEKLQERASKLIHAKDLAGLVRDHRIPLVFLEACQTAVAEEDVTASVAGRMLQQGVTSVVAMSHSVLVETARRFVEAFYGRLAEGATVGRAMLAGQKALWADKHRGKIPGAGDLDLHDWFVPVLYQEQQDPQLFGRIPSESARRLMETARKLSLGELPEPPPHQFVGRSRELLALQRLLDNRPYAVVCGQGGEGKTTLAVELARWLVRSAWFVRAAFISMEDLQDVRTVVDQIGKQILPEGPNWSVADFKDTDEALKHIDRAVRDNPTILVIDNMESILPDHTGEPPPAAPPVEELFELCQRLLKADKATRIVFTSREPLPAPFDDRAVGLGALSLHDAVELVGTVMKREGLEPKSADPGGTPELITDLVEAVRRHARALVLLSREIARQGVGATTADLNGLMAELHKKYPDDRERSLFASLELSLRRLSPETQEKIRVLAVFHGGAHVNVIAQMIDGGAEVARKLATELIDVGLAEPIAYGHLRLDPALPAYLLGRMDETEQEQTRGRWADAMRALSHFLYEQLWTDSQMVATLTLLELPNLLPLLDWFRDKVAAELLVDLAQLLETLIARLGRPRALARVVAVREEAAKGLGKWSHSAFTAASHTFDRFLDSGDLRLAHESAEKLLADSLRAGEDAYPEAASHIAMAYSTFGRALKEGGAAEAALEPLAEAQRRLEALAAAGNRSAERTAVCTIIERGDSLRDLGRFDDAVQAYEEAIQRSESLDDRRSVAVIRGQLGSVRRRQGRFADALAVCHEARATFEALGEPGSVATFWYQIGIVYQDARQFKEAEQAYRQSLAIKVQQKDGAGEASTLNQLGELYRLMGRFDDAVNFYRQAAEKLVAFHHMAREGLVRSNAAIALIELDRHAEARRELERAIECKEPYGHAVEPWKTWSILYDLERAEGNPQAARKARQKAIQAFLDYRRAGGENHEDGGRLSAMIGQAIAQNQTQQAEAMLSQLTQRPDLPDYAKALIPKLHAILTGSRDAALADDPKLEYDDAAELLLLLEQLPP